jgi:hypothetical protein
MSFPRSIPPSGTQTEFFAHEKCYEQPEVVGLWHVTRTMSNPGFHTPTSIHFLTIKLKLVLSAQIYSCDRPSLILFSVPFYMCVWTVSPTFLLYKIYHRSFCIHTCLFSPTSFYVSINKPYCSHTYVISNQRHERIDHEPGRLIWLLFYSVTMFIRVYIWTFFRAWEVSGHAKVLVQNDQVVILDRLIRAKHPELRSWPDTVSFV